MELLTRQFGGIQFQAAEVLVFETGLLYSPDDRQWLLVADSSHSSLFWLQCISNCDVAIPITPANRFIEEYRFELSAAEKQRLAFKSDDKLAVFVPLSQRQAEVVIDLHLPIIIDDQSGRGLQLRNERYQPLQRLMSEPSSPLRQSA